MSAFDGDAGKYVPWPNEPTLDNFRFLFEERDVGRALRNSLFVSVTAMVLATVLASLAGFALSRLRFRHKTYAVYAVLLLYAIPIAATMVAIYDLADLEKSLYVHSGGQSGNLLSEHYKAFAQAWSRNEYIPMRAKRETLEKEAHQLLKLVPAN